MFQSLQNYTIPSTTDTPYQPALSLIYGNICMQTCFGKQHFSFDNVPDTQWLWLSVMCEDGKTYNFCLTKLILLLFQICKYIKYLQQQK